MPCPERFRLTGPTRISYVFPMPRKAFHGRVRDGTEARFGSAAVSEDQRNTKRQTANTGASERQTLRRYGQGDLQERGSCPAKLPDSASSARNRAAARFER
jgi:hypothetical protein